MIRPGVPAPALAPRLGREILRERQGVRYHELRTRSLLNRCDSPNVPFDWTVNPYRVLFLRSPTREAFLSWLGREVPHLLPAYRRAYAGRSHLAPAYAERLGRRLDRLCARHGLARSPFGRPGRRGAETRQLRLFT